MVLTKGDQMLNSIKSKITVLTFSLLFVLGLVVTSAAILAFYQDRESVISANNANITAFEGELNREIAELEKNAMDLAVMGEIFYQKGKQKEVGEFFITTSLESLCNVAANTNRRSSNLVFQAPVLGETIKTCPCGP